MISTRRSALSTVTITDVAKRVGVSVATISRYLSGFTVRNADEIREVISELNYRPSAAARNLKSGRTGIIAIVVPDVTNPFFASIVEGAESAVGDDRMVLLVNTGATREREEKALTQLFGRVDGVIMVPSTEEQVAPAFFSQLGLPIVFVDRVTHDGERFSSVLAENAKGAEIATTHLVNHGHSAIAMIAGPQSSTPGKRRAEGFRSAMEKADLPILPEFFIESDFSEAGGYAAMDQLLQLETPPTAVFTSNNLMTIGALHALRAAQVSIPEQISVISFDDLSFADLISPSITVISRDARLQGSQAMQMMINQLDRAGAIQPEHSMVDVQLVERGSCAPPRESQKIRSTRRATE
jgi:DNA-binding LacI/PurR family transcriptional regulator